MTYGSNKGEKDRLIVKYFRVMNYLRSQDLVEFTRRHDELYKEAQTTGDHEEVTQHYYSLITPIAEKYFGTSLHFCPPEHPKQPRAEAKLAMHLHVSRLLDHGPGKEMLDVGCGTGGMMRDIAHYSGGRVTGVTLGHDEAEAGNRMAHMEKLQYLCTILQGNCEKMTFEDNRFDSAYAVYALKYMSDVKSVFQELNRVLKPGGLFLIYDIVKTDKFDAKNPEHMGLVAKFEYMCGMPPLRSNPEMIDMAKDAGLECITQMDLSYTYPWYYYFNNRLLMWAMTSSLMNLSVSAMEKTHLLPRGFRRFNDKFLAGTCKYIADAGKKEIITGSDILIFRKPQG
jgi:ubiquinone/menaquinone biosynthesis C-methylase UbiE